MYGGDDLICTIISIILALICGVILLYDSFVSSAEQIFSLQHFMRPLNLAAIACLCGALFVLFISQWLEGGHPLRGTLRKYGPKKGYYICDELKTLEPEIIDMCMKLRIKALEVKIKNEESAGALSLWFEYPEVFFSHKLLRKLGNKELILLVLGHELAHIHTGDTYYRHNRKLLAVFLLIFIAAFYAFGYIGSRMVGRLPAAWIWLVPHLILFCTMFILVNLFIAPAWGDIRYWGQVNELRADRIGLWVSGVSEAAFKKMAACLSGNAADYKSVYCHSASHFTKAGQLWKVIEKCWKEKFYSIVEDSPHPSWDVRVGEIEKYGQQKWGIKDELRYMVRFSWNIRFHQKWRL